VNGTQVSSVSASQFDGPIRVLLLIDTSASMKQKVGDSLGIAVPTAALAMDSVPLNAAVAVGRFAERLQLSQWQDRDSAREQVLSLKYQPPKGTTALYSAVNEATSMFRGLRVGDTIYLITDGGENHSAVSSRQLVEDLVRRGIRVFVFLVRPAEGFKTPEERNGAQDMEDLANLTGGALLDLPWSQEFITTGAAAVVARQLREEVGSPYQIDFQLGASINKPSKLKLESGIDPKHYTLAYPRRLEPCVAGTQNQP
jgi:hypothetical protein